MVVFIPVPKAKSVIITLPKVRSLMKKVDELLTLRAAQVPLNVMQSRYRPMINQSMNMVGLKLSSDPGKNSRTRAVYFDASAT